MNKIIAIVGMCGSVKSLACDLLEKKDYKKVYFGGVTLSKLEEEGLEDTPENEKYMREKLRSTLGMGAYALVLLPEIMNLVQTHNVVLDGLYSWEELKILKEKFGNQLKTIAIIVDKKIRYERLNIRPIRALSAEQAEKRDISEIENIAKAGPIAYADYYIDNNKTIKDFETRLDYILKKIERNQNE